MSRVQIPSSAPSSRGRPKARPRRPTRPRDREVRVHRASPRSDRAAVERAIQDLIQSLGLDPATEPELRDTPARVADLYAEIFRGLDPAAEPEVKLFPHQGAGDDLVIVRDLPFHSMCVHHLVPFFGRAHIAYLPDRHIAGISAGARLLDHYAHRPQLQERLTTQIADHLERALAPRGIAVILVARHLCMEMRGVRKAGVVETRVVRGALADPRWAGALDVRR